MLRLTYTEDQLLNEYSMYCKSDCDKLSSYQNNFKIVKFFQQEEFFKVEKTLWQDPDIREKLILNRCKYLNKSIDELTTEDILDGFKRSGTYYGFSHFNPKIFSWFIKNCKVQCCYDCCGGWGDRLLGSKQLKTYIYNDLSLSVKQNVDKIIKHFNITNAITYSNDARTFIPNECFDSMFTCPPYFNVEHYQCGDFKDIDDFKDFISSLFDVYNKKETCKTFGLVIREDMIFDHIDYVEKHLISRQTTRYLNKKMNRFNEYLYIYRKKT